MFVAVTAGIQCCENMQKEFVPGMFRCYVRFRFPHWKRWINDTPMDGFAHHD